MMDMDDANRAKKGEKLGRHLVFLMAKAVRDYAMISQDDRIMVCHSGGKDSFALLDLLLQLLRQSPFKFQLVAVGLDQNMPGFPGHVLPEFFEKTGVEYHIIQQDIYGTVTKKIPPGKNMCGLCSRLRRGALYRFAEENQMTKIALGHHRDDMVETLFLNLFYGGKMKSMPPKLLTESGKHVVIRPMAYISEEDLKRYALLKKFPVIPGNLCGASESSHRQVIKSMLRTWNKEFPGRIETIFNSMRNVEPSHLADVKLFDFKGLDV